MAQFASEIVQVSSSVGTVASMIWNPGNTSTTTYGSLGSVSSTAVLSNLVIANTGAYPFYIGSGSVSAAVATGLEVAAYSEVYVSGYLGTGAAAGTVWANTSVVGDTSSAQVGMASVPSVI